MALSTPLPPPVKKTLPPPSPDYHLALPPSYYPEEAIMKNHKFIYYKSPPPSNPCYHLCMVVKDKPNLEIVIIRPLKEGLPNKPAYLMMTESPPTKSPSPTKSPPPTSV